MFVGLGGGLVVGEGSGVSVAGAGVGVRVGTVPCEVGIAHTTGSIENIANSNIINISAIRFDFTILFSFLLRQRCVLDFKLKVFR